MEDAFATETDLETRNGVIHIIDRILTPPRLRVIEQLREGNFRYAKIFIEFYSFPCRLSISH